MKAGKEAIIGAMAALEYRERQDIAAWTAEQDRKVQLYPRPSARCRRACSSVGRSRSQWLSVLAGAADTRSRRRVHTAASLRDALAEGNPTIVVRAHHVDEGYINLDAIEMTDEEIECLCQRVREVLMSRDRT